MSSAWCRYQRRGVRECAVHHDMTGRVTRDYHRGRAAEDTDWDRSSSSSKLRIKRQTLLLMLLLALCDLTEQHVNSEGRKPAHSSADKTRGDVILVVINAELVARAIAQLPVCSLSTDMMRWSEMAADAAAADDDDDGVAVAASGGWKRKGGRQRAKKEYCCCTFRLTITSNLLSGSYRRVPKKMEGNCHKQWRGHQSALCGCLTNCLLFCPTCKVSTAFLCLI